LTAETSEGNIKGHMQNNTQQSL